MKTDQSSRKNITKLQIENQPIRRTVQNIGNQDAHRIVECGHKVEEKVKSMQS